MGEDRIGIHVGGQGVRSMGPLEGRWHNSGAMGAERITSMWGFVLSREQLFAAGG